MLQLPTSLVILGIPYKITYIAELGAVDTVGSEELYGQADITNCEIRLYVNRPREAILSTLVHEIMHAIDLTLGLSFFEKPINHNKMDMLAVALTDTIVRNNIFASGGSNGA
jgi:hypothetical protein